MSSIKQHRKHPEKKEILPISTNNNITFFTDTENSIQTAATLNPRPSNEPELVSDVGQKFEACDNPIYVCKKFILDRFPRLRSGTERTRVYHLWPGKNVFFFDGRLVCGPDPRGFLLTTLSILLSSWIFCVYIGDDLKRNSGLVVALALILTIIVLANLVLVSAIDPGIIPRNDKITKNGVDNSEVVPSKKVRVNGVQVKLKFCRVCKIFRPPRSCHCAICDNCVEKFDHHCPWIGQCIGLRNYRFYLTFIISALAFFIYIFSFSCRRIHQKMSETRLGLFITARNCPETLALAAFSFFATWFIGGVASFHTYLIMLNETAYENHRQCYAESPNPYNKGILRNINEALCTGLPPSRVDFRAEMTVRDGSAEQGNTSCLLNRVNAMKILEGQHSNDRTKDHCSRKKEYGDDYIGVDLR